MTEQLPSGGPPQDMWKNRRRMSWSAMGCLVGMVVAAGFGIATGTELSGNWLELLKMLGWPLAGIVLGYTGSATYDDIQGRKP